MTREYLTVCSLAKNIIKWVGLVSYIFFRLPKTKKTEKVFFLKRLISSYKNLKIHLGFASSLIVFVKIEADQNWTESQKVFKKPRGTVVENGIKKED